MYKLISIKDIFKFLKKSKIKAGEGLSEGKYPFYTSSNTLSRYLDYYEIEEESIILGTGGNASVHYCEGKFSVSTDCYVIQPKIDDVSTKYVYYYLSDNIYILEQGFKGAGLKHISKKYLQDIKIPLPPLQIQEKIVEVLDKAQELIDLRKKQIELLDKLIESTFYDMFGDPVVNPKGWEEKQIGDIFEVKTGSTPSRKTKEYWDIQEVPWVKTNEVNNGVITSTEEYISFKALKETSVSLFPINTILIAMYGQGKTRGKVAMLGIEATTNQACAALLPTNKVNVNYMFNYLKVSYEELRRLGRGGNQPNLNLSLVRNFKVPVPPIKIQNEFAQKVEKIEETRELMQESLDEMEKNYNSLMQRAFRGELFY